MFVTADMFQAPMGWLKASAPKNMVLAFHHSIKIWDTWALPILRVGGVLFLQRPKIAESNVRQQTIALGVVRACAYY